MPETLPRKISLSHPLLKNALALAVVQAFNYVSPIVLLSVLTKTLGFSEYSRLAFVLAVASFASIVIDFGFNLSAVARVSKYRTSRTTLCSALASVTTSRLLILFVVVVLISLLIQKNSLFANYALPLFASTILLLANALLPLWFFQGLEKMHLVMFVQVLSKILTLVSVMMLVLRSNPSITVVVIVYGLCALAGAIVSWSIVLNLGYTPHLRKQHLVATVLHGSRYFYSRLASVSYSSLNAMLLGLVGQVESVGYYSIAEQVEDPL
ncbi:MAG: oligosaccharide flippase family protein [Pseudomonadota bacterium]